MKLLNYAAALIIVALAMLFLVEGRALLVPLALAVLFWVLIDGLAGVYHKIAIGGHAVPRWLALTAAVLTVLGITTLVVMMVSQNVASVASAAPEYQRKFEALIERIGPTFGYDRVPRLAEVVKRFDVAPVIGVVAGTVAGLLGNVGLVLVYLLFLFVEQAAFETKIRALFPDPDRRERVRRILREINEDTRKYMRLKTAMAASTGTCSYIVLKLVGVDYAIFWAFVIFLLNFIPTVGSIIGITFPALLTLVQFETLWPFLVVSIGLTSIEIVINNIVEPKLMGGALNVSSLAVILSLALWGTVWGIVGMFLSVPIMVILMIIFANIEQTRGIAVLLSADGNIKESRMLQSVPDLEPARETIEVPGRGAFSVLRWDGPADRPLLVFTHATGFNAGTYRKLLGPLAHDFRIVAPDQRGHGLSTAPADPDDLRSWGTFGDDLVALLELLGEPAVLSGHSMGGRVAMLAAAPRRRALVMIEPVLMHPTVSRFLATARRFGRPPPNPLAQGAARRRAVYGTRQMMFDAYKGRGALATWPDEVLRDYIDGGSRDLPNGEVTLSCAPAWEAATFASAGQPFWREMGKVRCPVHILYAERESTLREEVPDMICKRQPDWALQLVPGTTHFLPMEQPALVRETILQMVR